MIQYAKSITADVDGESGSQGLQRILIVEDDPALVQLLSYIFENESFEVKTTGDGEEALLLAEHDLPDVLLLDWMILNLSGIEVLKRLRQSPSTAGIPVIMVSAKSEEADRVSALTWGADDYLTKPVSPRELVARVRAVLRRGRYAVQSELLTFHDLKLDLSQHKVWRGGKRITLGSREFWLLHHFMKYPERVFSRERLIDALWGTEAEIERRTIDVLIRRLRIAINSGFDVQLIRTVRSEGYSLSSSG